MKPNDINVIKKKNKIVMLVCTIYVIILFLCCVLLFHDNSISTGGIVVFCLFAVVPLIVSLVINRTQTEVSEENNPEDVIKDLQADIGQAMEQLNAMGESSQNIANSMEEMAQKAGSAWNSIQAQIGHSNHIETAINQAEDCTQNISNNAEEARTEIDAVSSMLESLNYYVKETKGENEKVSNLLVGLVDYSNQLETQVKDIHDMNSRTSLLSLNASIEAARAGEAGRDFAVVASEIAMLTTNVQETTDRIDQLITDFTKALGKVVETMDEALRKGDTSFQEAGRAAKGLMRVYDATRKMDQESQTLREDLNKLTELNKNMEGGMEDASNATDAITGYSNDALVYAREHQKISKELKESVDHMTDKIDDYFVRAEGVAEVATEPADDLAEEAQSKDE